MVELIELEPDPDLVPGTWEGTGRLIVDLGDAGAGGPRGRERHTGALALAVLMAVMLVSPVGGRDRDATGAPAVAMEAASHFSTTHPHPRIPASTPSARAHRGLLPAYSPGGSTYLSQVPRPR